MIKYALLCDAGHGFEAWFSNSAGYESQRAAELIVCPTCGATEVRKAIMAPNVALGRAEPTPPPLHSASPEELPSQKSTQAPSQAPSQAPPHAPSPALAAANAEARRRFAFERLRALRAHVEATADYVGDDFAEEARAIHEGDARVRAIYGESTPEETRELLDEGVPIAPLPWVDDVDD